MDIVHWLRNEVQMVFLQGEPNRLHEAADEIERLREKNKKLIEATSAFHIAVYNALFAFDKTLDELEKVNQ